MTQIENNHEKSYNPIKLIDFLKIFLSNKKKIFLSTLIVCLISILFYFFVFDLIYYSSASIKSNVKSGGLLGSLDAGLPDITGLDEIGIGGGKSAKQLAEYEEILQSRRCLEETINKFGLMQRDKYEFMEDAVKDFRTNKLEIKQEKLAGVMYIGVFDKDKNVAKEIVDYLLIELDKINIELNVLSAKNNREFIEKRYYQAKEDLTKAEDSLKSFQLINGISPDLQTKAAAQSAFTIEAEIKAEEIKLDVLKKILSPDQIEVKTEEAKINALKEQLAGIKNSTDLNDFLRLGNAPVTVMSFLRLQREVEIQSKILTFLLPVYEQAKIEEKRETPTIIVLDKAFIADKKAKPKRLTMVLILTSLGFFFNILIFVLLDRFKKYRLYNF